MPENIKSLVSGSFFVTAPAWQIGLIIFGGMIAAMLAGKFLRRRHDRTKSTAQKAEDRDNQEPYIVSAVMGLLALLIGFTFALAIDRFDTRRTRVVFEANAIGTTYLRAQLLDKPYRALISDLLVDYTDNRILLAGAQRGAKVQAELLAINDKLLIDLWSATVAAFPSMRPYDFSSTFLESMNKVIDYDAERKAARRAHVPQEVFIVLLSYQFIAAGVFGYVLVGPRSQAAAAFLFLLFGLSLMLIIDIDRPTTGGIQESQEAMVRLLDMMKKQPPETFDRFIER